VVMPVCRQRRAGRQVDRRARDEVDHRARRGGARRRSVDHRLQNRDRRLDTQQVPDDLQFLIGAPIPLEAVNAAGNELTRAPEFSFFLAARYDVPLAADYRGTFELAYRYQDEVFFLETNQSQDTFAADSSDRLDARFSFGPQTGRWEGAVYVKNVTDDRTITQVTALGSFPNAAVNAPQQWGAEFTYRWE